MEVFEPSYFRLIPLIPLEYLFESDCTSLNGCPSFPIIVALVGSEIGDASKLVPALSSLATYVQSTPFPNVTSLIVTGIKTLCPFSGFVIT